MRLPWLQLTGDGKRRAKSFGQLLGIGAHAGVGFVVDLWEAALDLAPEGDFSGCFADPSVLVAHAGGNPPGCSAEPARVVELLQVVGLVATHPELRVRGLDRYRATWTKNRKHKGTRAEPGGNPERKTKTKTKTEKKITTASAPHTRSDQEICWDLMELQRVEHCEAAGIEPGTSERPHPSKINARINAAVTGMVDREVDGETITRFDDLAALHRAQYLGEAFGRVDRDGNPRNPPWPTELFLSPNVLANCRRKYDEVEPEVH